jgi:hypothetical protein
MNHWHNRRLGHRSTGASVGGGHRSPVGGDAGGKPLKSRLGHRRQLARQSEGGTGALGRERNYWYWCTNGAWVTGGNHVSRRWHWSLGRRRCWGNHWCNKWRPSQEIQLARQLSGTGAAVGGDVLMETTGATTAPGSQEGALARQSVEVALTGRRRCWGPLAQQTAPVTGALARQLRRH